MPRSPIVLLDRVSAVGLGPVIDMREQVIEPVLWSIEPSANAKIDTSVGMNDAIEILCGLDEESAWTVNVEGYGVRCLRVARMPVIASNPSGLPQPVSVSYVQHPDVELVPGGRKWMFPFLRARLKVPLAAGTLTLKFFFD